MIPMIVILTPSLENAVPIQHGWYTIAELAAAGVHHPMVMYHALCIINRTHEYLVVTCTYLLLECKDLFPDVSQCRAWKNLGQCDRNPAWMRANCRMTCGLCSDESTGECDYDLSACPTSMYVLVHGTSMYVLVHGTSMY